MRCVPNKIAHLPTARFLAKREPPFSASSVSGTIPDAMKNRFRPSPAATTAGLDQGTRLRLKTCGFISVVMLVLNVALEIITIYDAHLDHLLILSTLAMSLALWSLLEAVNIRYVKQQRLIRQVRRVLMLQIAVLAARAVLILLGQGIGADDTDSYRNAIGGAPLGFLLLYVANFTFINQIIQGILFGSERLAAEEVQQVTNTAARLRERERILQDVHDGLGSHLVTARIRAQRSTVSEKEFIEILGDCIAELHLIVDVMNETQITLFDAMTDFRHRFGRRVAYDGVKLAWDLRPEGLPAMTERYVMQIMRISQEALTNAVRHSNGTEILIQVIPSDGGVQVTIADNGTRSARFAKARSCFDRAITLDPA